MHITFLENNHVIINFDINKTLRLINNQNIVCINSVLEELHMYDEVKKYKFNNIINLQNIYFKKNDIVFQYFLDNKTITIEFLIKYISLPTNLKYKIKTFMIIKLSKCFLYVKNIVIVFFNLI